MPRWLRSWGYLLRPSLGARRWGEDRVPVTDHPRGRDRARLPAPELEQGAEAVEEVLEGVAVLAEVLVGAGGEEVGVVEQVQAEREAAQVEVVEVLEAAALAEEVGHREIEERRVCP
jgi:hypothetical protein